MTTLENILKSTNFDNVTPFDLNSDPFFVFDFTDNNQDLSEIDLNDQESFNTYIFESIKKEGANFGIGRYNENRVIYKRSDLFSDEESRSLHLGVDIWSEAGTPVFAPFDAIVHSFANNDNHGDYGPTIILEHFTRGLKWYSLYGHLSRESIDGLTVGETIKKGKKFASFGTYVENVHWPPHLHFQIIKDMMHYRGDFPGVCKPSEKVKWLANSPDPMLVLK
jgi:murein DD-endopeptidase MepM/ murein hydrolase activator NlpD